MTAPTDAAFKGGHDLLVEVAALVGANLADDPAFLPAIEHLALAAGHLVGAKPSCDACERALDLEVLAAAGLPNPAVAVDGNGDVDVVICPLCIVEEVN